MATAKNRALDRLRRDKVLQGKLEQIGHDLDAQEALIVPDFVDALDDARADEIGDDLLRLIFTACHPVLSTDARVALTLKLLGGLTTHEIARAYLVPEPTIAQRIVRAKRTLSEAHVPFELPPGAVLGERLASVLEVVYLVFNEGYTATAGEDWMRPALCDEALRLGRMLAELAPASIRGAWIGGPHGTAGFAREGPGRRQGAAGPADGAGPCALGPPPHSPRPGGARTRAKRWEARSDATRCRQPLQPATPARAHPPKPTGPASRRSTMRWRKSRRHRWSSSIAPSRWAWPSARPSRWKSSTRCAGEKSLQNYQWLPSVRGDLLARLGRNDEARAEFERAASHGRQRA